MVDTSVIHGWRAIQRVITAQYDPLMPYPDFATTIVPIGDPCLFTPPGDVAPHLLLNVFVPAMGAVRVLGIPPQHVDTLVGLYYRHGPRTELRVDMNGVQPGGTLGLEERSLIDGCGSYDLEPLISAYIQSIV